MHRKLKKVLSGLTMACLALVGAALFGEPVPHDAGAAPASITAVPSAADPDAETARVPVQVDLPGVWIHVHPQGTKIHFVPAVPVTDARPAQPRAAAFQMPYFSFGAMLPRAPSSTES